jgi:uncharacterized protein (TIGR00297 family)
MSLVSAVVIAVAVSAVAWRLRALTGAGAVAAGVVGSGILWGAGAAGGLILAAFFVPGSLVSRLTERRTPSWVDAKGNQRDAVQVLANGGVALLGGLVAHAAAADGVRLLSGALAAAAADTWATSIGTLSRREPVVIISGRRVPTGTSGAVSIVGTVGALVGAGLVAATAGLAVSQPGLAWTALVTGVLGMVADSVLGATVQGRYRCPDCGVGSERRRHRCGTATIRVGGSQWVDNDLVNALATGFAGVVAWLWR